MVRLLARKNLLTVANDDAQMGHADLERVREWAAQKLSMGKEPPWSWYQLMKLSEAIDAILAGMASTRPTADLQGAAAHQGACLRLVGAIDPPENAQSHPVRSDIPMPM